MTVILTSNNVNEINKALLMIFNDIDKIKKDIDLIKGELKIK